MKVFYHPVFLSLVLGTSLRLWLSLTTFGTNDVRSWELFMNTIVQHGMVDVYQLIGYFNHPPFMAFYLRVISHVTEDVPNGFPFLIRLPAILADVGSTLLVYRLFSRLWNPRKALTASLLIALSPVLILISGFHGNTDPVYLFLILLSAERLILGNNIFLSGMILGFSLNIKIVPVVTLPLFFLWLAGWKNRSVFLSGLIIPILAGYGFHLAVAYETLSQNVFQYSSNAGMWGITQILKALTLQRPWQIAPLKLIMVGAISLKILNLSLTSRKYEDPRRQGQFLLKGLGWTFLLFLVWAPGFSVQYLSWIVPTGIFLSLKRSIQFNILSGIFLFSVYNNWNNGMPWNIAESVTWNPFEYVYCLVVWGFLVRWSWKMRDRKSFGNSLIFRR